MGRSIRTGPGRPERMRWKAWLNTCGTRAGSRTVTAHLVTGLAIGAWPVMHRIGMESADAE